MNVAVEIPAKDYKHAVVMKHAINESVEGGIFASVCTHESGRYVVKLDQVKELNS